MTNSYPTVVARKLSNQPSAKKGGFTLIELLMVIAVILILAGITFGISRGVQNAQARAKAKAELAMLSQALEQFKLTYGDYPWISGDPTLDASANALLEALTGWKVLSASGGTAAMQDVAAADGPKKSFIDPTKMSTNVDFPAGKPANVRFIDPWGNPYAYVYGKSATSNTWENFGYVLFSEGSDGGSATTGFDTATGIIDPATYRSGKNIDNIFAGE